MLLKWEDSLYLMSRLVLKLPRWDFPGGPVVKNPPTNAGDIEPRSGKIPNAAEQLSPCTTTTEPAL